MRNPMARLPKDFFGGALMVLIGVATVVGGARYSIGSLNRMGPGFFPVAVGALLALVGLAIVGAAWLERAPPVAEIWSLRRAEWRGWFCIVGSMVAFIVLGRHAGFVPAASAAVFISALGDRDNTVKSAVLLTILMLAICVVVFWWALQMPIPLFRWG